MKTPCRLLSLLYTVLVPLASSATDYKPWYGPLFEIEAKADCTVQAFNHVDSHHSCGKRPEVDTFLDLSASMAVWETIAAELEVSGLQSRHKSGLEAARLTGRYRWLNDIVGDPVSLSTGLTFSTIFTPARRNIATFDHGGIAFEGHVAVGKEVSCMQFWTSRVWGVFAAGIADVGSPWLRANIAWEHNWWNRHRVELFTDTLWGLGNNNLNLHHFHGYGSVQYQAVDMGTRYSYQTDCGLLLSIGYAYRIYGRNCPQNVNFALFRISYPFGL